MAVLRTRRRKILAAIAAVLLGAVGYCFGYEPRYTGSLVTPPSQPLVFAHRGFGNYGPDNSLYAVNKALDTGMDGVDMDGQLTSDGEIVIFHDLSVDRLTAGTGRVRGKTTKEMLALDLGPKYNPAIHGDNFTTTRPMLAPINTSEKKCAVSIARVSASPVASASQSGARIGMIAQSTTATQKIVIEWPEGKESYCSSQVK